jgi:heme-degrading monooxygenase HmoA
MTEASDQLGYYAVIATTTLKPMSAETRSRYLAMSDRMLELACRQEGFLGRDHARDDNLGISVSYWRSTEAIHAWRTDASHMAVKEFGRREVYQTWHIRICRVEREYGNENQ